MANLFVPKQKRALKYFLVVSHVAFHEAPLSHLLPCVPPEGGPQGFHNPLVD